jgi:hypothetical protein
VFSVDPTNGSFTTLGRPRDPDQVVEADGTVYVAAHGDSDVLAIAGGSESAWAQGASAVALAADVPMNLLVVVVNSHE